MTTFEEKMKLANEEEKIVYYDYLNYKIAAGWRDGFISGDWTRPTVIKKAKYNGEFLDKLPDYYFLGIPIKELLKITYSEGHCHACAVALSLYFDDFEIMTCNLKNYAEYCTIKSGKQIKDYEHTVLLTYIDDKKIVIDTTFGFITDIDTYKNIFNPNEIRIITKKHLEETSVYQHIKSHINYKGSPLGFNQVYKNGKWVDIPEEIKYRNIIHKHMDMCRNYTNDNNHLEDFIRRCLFRTSNSHSFWNWKGSLEFKYGNLKYVYPTVELYSLKDDEFDFNLYSTCKDTIERNNKILEDYHKPQIIEEVNISIKDKILSLIKRK